MKLWFAVAGHNFIWVKNYFLITLRKNIVKQKKQVSRSYTVRIKVISHIVSTAMQFEGVKLTLTARGSTLVVRI